MNSAATFDPNPFLRALDDDCATFLEFGRQFLAILPGSLASLYEAAAAGDAAALRERAHALKGSVAIFHAHPLLEELDAIERTCLLAPAEICALVSLPASGGIGPAAAPCALRAASVNAKNADLNR